jgi:hypothetical protein
VLKTPIFDIVRVLSQQQQLTPRLLELEEEEEVETLLHPNQEDEEEAKYLYLVDPQLQQALLNPHRQTTAQTLIIIIRTTLRMLPHQGKHQRINRIKRIYRLVQQLCAG